MIWRFPEGGRGRNMLLIFPCSSTVIFFLFQHYYYHQYHARRHRHHFHHQRHSWKMILKELSTSSEIKFEQHKSKITNTNYFKFYRNQSFVFFFFKTLFSLVFFFFFAFLHVHSKISLRGKICFMLRPFYST